MLYDPSESSLICLESHANLLVNMYMNLVYYLGPNHSALALSSCSRIPLLLGNGYEGIEMLASFFNPLVLLPKPQHIMGLVSVCCECTAKMYCRNKIFILSACLLNHTSSIAIHF